MNEFDLFKYNYLKYNPEQINWDWWNNESVMLQNSVYFWMDDTIPY